MRPLTQVEADTLIKMEKRAVSDTVYDYPTPGSKLEVPLQAVAAKEQFILDLSRGRINLEKRKYQNRARTSIILLRLDTSGPAHENPDGTVVPCPHLHVYSEGHDDKIARPPLDGEFSDFTKPETVLADFMRLCRIVEPPKFQGLFK